MTFPPGPPDGRSLPTLHGKEQETKGTPKGTFKAFKRILRVAFISKKNQTSISNQLSIEAENVSSSAPFRLLDLPRELRDLIYNFMIHDPDTDPCDKFNAPWKKTFATR